MYICLYVHIQLRGGERWNDEREEVGEEMGREGGGKIRVGRRQMSRERDLLPR